MASARKNRCRQDIFSTITATRKSIHEAFDCGTGGDGVLRRCSRSRNHSACVGIACSGSDRRGAVDEHRQVRHHPQEVQEEEGEKIHGRGECVHRLAHEAIKKAHHLFLSKPERRGIHMNKVLVALIAGAFATLAAAQGTNPVTHPSPASKAKQADVSATTQAGSTSSTTNTTAAEQAKNVKASKETAKMTKEQKKAFAKDATKMNVNPDNSSGQAATSAMQKETTAESKGQPKANTQLKTKEGKKELSKDLQQKASP
jgi:hypothetical protein